MKTIYVAPDNETIPEFAAVIVHEVRNPLTTIKLSVRMIEAKTEDDELKKYLDIISKSARRIDDLVSDLLNSSPAHRDVKETISLHELLDEVLHQADDRLLLKEIAVTKEYDVQDMEISVNKAQLKIAFTNIIINAIDAMAPQTGRLKIVTILTADNYIVRIEDNGCGIKAENLNNIFKPYFTDKPHGLGLGLTATQKILNSNDIEIVVGSKLGAGTAFTLLFNKNYRNEGLESVRLDRLTILQAETSG